MKKILMLFLLVLSSCAHPSQNLGADIRAADKRCALQDGHPWPNTELQADCLNESGRAVIKSEYTVALSPFNEYASKRKLLAQKFDEEINPSTEAGKRYSQGWEEASVVLAAQEPRAINESAALHKDITASNLGVCNHDNDANMEARVMCLDAITRPIWERDAPDTIKFYNEFQKKRLQLAKAYDASGAVKVNKLANEHLQQGLKEAGDVYLNNVQQIIRQQQAATTQAPVASSNDPNLLGELVQSFAQGAGMIHSPQSTAPTTVQPVQPTITHTNCQYNTVFHQTQCTTTPY